MSSYTNNDIRKWSIAVRWRDRKCRICGSRENLEAHHLYDKSHFPEFALDMDNGVTLCGSSKRTGNACHMAFHTKFMGDYRRSCTRVDFKRFERIVKWARAI